jgi:hypothetical protein
LIGKIKNYSNKIKQSGWVVLFLSSLVEDVKTILMEIKQKPSTELLSNYSI